MSSPQTAPDPAFGHVMESSHSGSHPLADSSGFSNLLITVLLAIALIPSVFLLFVNGQEALRRLGPFTSLKPSGGNSLGSSLNASASFASTNRPPPAAVNRPMAPGGGSGSNKMTTALYFSQVCAAVCNLVNQILFLALHVTPASSLLLTYETAPSAITLANGSKSPQYSTLGCSIWTGIADTFYLLFQPLATMVLIWRATGIVPRWTATPGPMGWLTTRTGVRTVLTTLFVVGLIPVTASVFLRTIEINYTFNKCDVQYPITANNVGKLVFFVVYAVLGAVFCIPLLRHLKSMRKYSSPTTNGGANAGAAPMIIRVLRDVGFRIVVAVITYLVTAIAVLAGGFSARGAMSVAFTLQNLSALLAATFAVKSNEYDSSRTGSASRSAGASTSGGRGAGDEEAMRSQTLLGSDAEQQHQRSAGLFGSGNGGGRGSVRSQAGIPSYNEAMMELSPMECRTVGEIGGQGSAPVAKAAEQPGHHFLVDTPVAPRPVARSVVGRLPR